MPPKRKVKKISTIFDVLKSKTELADSTINSYVGRIKKVIEGVGNMQYETKQYPTAEEVSTTFQEHEKVIQHIHDLFPINEGDDEDEEQLRNNNIENRKAYFTAIVSVLKLDDIKDITDDIRNIYNDQMNEAKQLSETQRNKLLPTRNLKYTNGVKWNDIIVARDAFWTNKKKVISNMKIYLAVAFYTAIPPRRAEIRDITVHFDKEPRIKDKANYILITKNEIKMFLDTFKTRYRKGKQILPRYEVVLPADLDIWIREYVKKADIKNGSYLFQNSYNEGYQQAQFSTFIKSASVKVLNLDLSIDDYRHLYVTDYVVPNISQFNNSELQRIANAMGDLKIETNLSYRIAQQQIEDLDPEVPPPPPEMPDPIPEPLPPPPPPPEQQNENVILVENVLNALRPFLLKLLER
jgi:hypothetical protein